MNNIYSDDFITCGTPRVRQFLKLTLVWGDVASHHELMRRNFSTFTNPIRTVKNCRDTAGGQPVTYIIQCIMNTDDDCLFVYSRVRPTTPLETFLRWNIIINLAVFYPSTLQCTNRYSMLLYVHKQARLCKIPPKYRRTHLHDIVLYLLCFALTG